MWWSPLTQQGVAMIHEVGHALAAWASGGSVSGVEITPESRVLFRSPFPAAVWWAGYPATMVVGALLGRRWPVCRIPVVTGAYRA
ncbi:MAG: M50 family metallopeptidase, partial [Myxococcota bacterium]